MAVMWLEIEQQAKNICKDFRSRKYLVFCSGIVFDAFAVYYRYVCLERPQIFLTKNPLGTDS